jgi:hypothetical protein
MNQRSPVEQLGVAVKFLLVASFVSIAAYGAQVLPSASQWAQTLDARPEALLTGGVLLVVASLLRRTVTGVRAR